ncbi:hypothetical protein GH714_018732 [Hevea brasiliensis]|uniref:Metal-nicotianamine transporter YSL7 n=1 Tax=Hevea brasiliensis TaxID=3981 RepID=A0A6A6ND17_HEVBR|nr:hypothetical protein GH714_018732 [Hevea brasiliensis]
MMRIVILGVEANLTTGVIPSLNVAAGLLGFGILKFWSTLLGKTGFLKQPFTRQENTVIQTCVVASSGIAFSSGTASYMLGMSSRIAAQAEGGNTPSNIKNLSIGWMIGFLFVVSFVDDDLEIQVNIPLAGQQLHTSSTASNTQRSQTGQVEYVKGWLGGGWSHDPSYYNNYLCCHLGSKLVFSSSSSVLVFCGLFQWFFTAGDGCGFASFPTFGLKAADERFYFDFSSTYVGVGMICPYMVNISLLLGAVISWGIMWPAIETKKDLLPQVFIAIATMLGDGLYHVIVMLTRTSWDLIARNSKNRDRSSITPAAGDDNSQIINSDEERRKFFLKDQIPGWVALVGYICLATISIITVPFIFHQLKWYHILVAYAIAPVLAFCNAYGCGLTDWSLASNYGKFAIIIFSAWVGHDGGIVAGLASCGVMMSIVSTASDLMQDFKTGYLTLSSARSMFFSQVAGTAMGCLITPLVFWFFYSAYTIGDPEGAYPAPYGLIYRGIALLGVEGISSLPKHCLALSISFFIAAIAINAIRDLLQKFETTHRIYRFIPSPMCMAIPFYLGAYFAIDMFVGSLILFIWEKMNKRRATDFSPAVASGLICGDSLWGIPAAILSLTGVNPPICMKFLSAAANGRVDKFLSGN